MSPAQAHQGGAVDLVTGGAGFLGRHVVTALLARERRVRVLDIAPAPDLPAGVEVHTGSITDPEAVARAMDGVTRIFHLAAVPELWARDKTVFERINHQGTRTLLDAARRLPGLESFVHTSSEVVLVPRPGLAAPKRLDESVEWAPEDLIGPYAAGKRRAEQAVLAAAAEGLPATVAIPTMPLGPGDISRTPPTRMVADLLAGRTPAYADFMMNVVDARDAAEGHIAVAEHGAVGQRYILGGHNVRMSALLAELEPFAGRVMPHRRIPGWVAQAFAVLDTMVADRVTGRAPTAPRDGVTIARRQRPFDNTRARTTLDFTPRPLAVTLEDTAQWLRAAERGAAERGAPPS